MQSLFAFEQCREANYQLALDQIEDVFVPDLNSMEVQDKELLKQQRKQSRQLLEKKFENPALADSDDQTVTKAVDSSLSSYARLVKKDRVFFMKNMVIEVEKINDLYLSILTLITSFASVSSEDKKLSYANFVNHPWIHSLNTNKELAGAVAKNNAGWQNAQDKVRGWFRDIVKIDNEFKKYNALKSTTVDEQKLFLKHLIRKIILGKGAIQDHFEEEDIRWAEDKDIVKSLVDKTMKSKEDGDGAIELQKLSLDWEDDRDFMNRLFEDAIDLEPAYKELIAQNTKNWEVDRLPLTDRIILEMAIAELVGFPNIPVKVTINEYIELAKLYSTPKSRQFINGILDVIAKELQQSGAVKKSGRGLIDNK